MAQLGHPLDALPEREGVLDALYRLTDQGDPLLVTLWVGQLWRERERAPALRATDPQQLNPSFAGFLEVWMREQAAVWKAKQLDVHPDDFRRLLRVLSLARGPLRLQDLLAVVARLSFPVRWDFERTRAVLDSAFRLVVGDAHRQGYTFVHPRLGDHFRAELEGLKEEHLAVPRAYVDWGAAIVASLNDGALPPDQCPAYLLHHYTAHVEEAKLAPDDALDRYLLPLLGKGWHQAWYAEEGAYGGFLADLRRVQETLRQANRARRGSPYRISAELRCHLIRASLFSRTQNLPPRLIVALVEAGVWSLQRAVRVVEQLSDLATRTRALTGLAEQSTGAERQQVLQQALDAAARIDAAISFLDRKQNYRRDRAGTLAFIAEYLAGQPALLQRALDAVAGIGKEESRAEALVAVAAHLAGQPALLQQALDAAARIGNEEYRAKALAAVAKHLAEEQRQQVIQQALDAAAWIDYPRDRAKTVAGVAEYLAGQPTLLQQALDAADRIGDEEHRAEALAAVAEHLAGQPALLQQALDAAARIGDEKHRVKALAAVAKHLAEEQRQEVIQQALDAATGIDDEWYRARALAAVAEYLAGQPTLLQQALDAADRIGDEEHRAKTVAGVAEYLAGQPTLLQQALDAADRIGDEMHRANLLTAVAEHLAGQPALLQQALDAAARIGDEKYRVKALAAVAAHLAGEQRQQVFQQALDAAARIDEDCRSGYGKDRARALAFIAVHLVGQPTLLQQTLDKMARIANPEYCAWALAVAAVHGHLVGEKRQQVLQQALDAAARIRDEEFRTSTLAFIVEYLASQPTLLQQALDAAAWIHDEQFRAEALAAAAGHLAGKQRQQALQQALDAAARIDSHQRDDHGRAIIWALTAVVAHLGGQPTLLQQALDAAARIGDEEHRTEALVVVVAHLGGQPSLLQQALDAAARIGDPYYRAEALAVVAEHLAGQPELLQRTLDSVARIGDPYCCARVLSAVAGHLTGEQRQQVLRQALDAVARAPREGEYIRGCAKALATMAGHWTGEQRQQILQQAMNEVFWIGSCKDSIEVLVFMAGHLAGQPALLQQALSVAARIGVPYCCAPRVLAAVAGHLTGEQRQQVLRQALDAVARIHDNGHRAEALAAVAAYLVGPPALLQQALDAVPWSGDKGHSAEALVAVAAHLGGEQRQRILQQALDAADRIGDEEHRAKALAAVAKHLAGEQRQQVLQQALEAAARINYEWSRAWVLGAVASAWSLRCDYSHFIQMLDAMGASHRKDWLVLVQGLFPIITELGGEAAVSETADAIFDTACWWP